jgi:hypothetical protein
MMYPCFRLSQGRTALANHKDSVDSLFAEVAPEWRTAEGDLDQDDVQDILRELSKEVSVSAADRLRASKKSQDQVEGLLSLNLYDAVAELPAKAVTDPDFWRFVSVEVLRDFVYWRDGAECSQASFGLAAARRIPDCVPLRMFNRAHLARAVSEAGAYSDAEVCTAGGADFWQSHVLRVQNRFDPRLVGELVVATSTGDIENVQVLREVAKDVRRLRANFVLELQPDRALATAIRSIIREESEGK